MTDPFASVALMAQPSWRSFFFEFAKTLKARHSGKIFLYCGDDLSMEFYGGLNTDGTFDDIVLAPREAPGVAPIVTDEDAVIAQACANEKRLGETYNTFMITNRHLGRGFAPGGFNHPRSPMSERTSLVQAYAIYNNVLAFWDSEIDAKGLTLIINQKMPAVVAVAKSRGLIVRNPVDAHHKNFFHWSIDEKETNPLIELAFQSSTLQAQAAEVDAPPTAHVVARDLLLSRYGLKGMLKLLYQMTREQAYNHYKGNREGMYYLGSRIKYVLRQRRDGRRLIKEKSPTLADLAGKSFVFFPLHVEPEIALQGKSPEFLVQLSAIISLARHLPADTLLVVKEHISAAGRRPPAFYQQIRELKNVVWLDVRELGLEVVRASVAVATISGSAGFEAATMGIPVLTFGRHNLFNFLPHVFEIRDEVELGEYLKLILGGSVSKDAAVKDGGRFLESVKSVSFDLDDYNHFTGKGFSERSVEAAVDGLEHSVKSLAAPKTDSVGVR